MMDSLKFLLTKNWFNFVFIGLNEFSNSQIRFSAKTLLWLKKLLFAAKHIFGVQSILVKEQRKWKLVPNFIFVLKLFLAAARYNENLLGYLRGVGRQLLSWRKHKGEIFVTLRSYRKCMVGWSNPKVLSATLFAISKK